MTTAIEKTNVLKFEVIKDASELARMGVELANDIKSQDGRIALYLMSEVVHIEEHRNPSRLNLFFSRVKGTGARINAMHNFIQVFANVTFNKDANSAIQKDGTKNEKNQYARSTPEGENFAWFYSVNKVRKDTSKWTFAAHIAKANDTPWYSFQPERPVTAFNIDNSMVGLLKKAWKGQISGDNLVNSAFLSELTTLCEKHGVFESITDIIPDDLKAKVPDEYKDVLHMNDNVVEAGDLKVPERVRA